MRRHFFIALAAGFAFIAAGIFAYLWAQTPTTLKIVVGPIGSEDTRLVVAAAQHFARDRGSVRLKLVLSDGVGHSAKVLDEEGADLAIVRSDVAMPLKGQTVAIWHRDVAMLMTVPSRGLTHVGGLRDRSVGLVRAGQGNRELLQTVLAQYEIPKDGVTIVELSSAADIEAAFEEGRIDAVLAVGTVTGRTVTEAVAAVGQAGKAPPVFIPIAEADAIGQRLPAFEELEVVRGSFGGSPPRPPETFETLGMSHRLVARAGLDDATVAELTRALFAMRPSLAKEVALANRIEAPETTKGSSLPVHPGAAAYFDGEVQSFFDRYGDWFYFLIMVLSIVGSGAAGIAGSAANRIRARNMVLLSDLLRIVRRAHEAGSIAELDQLDLQADEILGAALSKAGSGGIDNAGVAAFTLGLDQARRAIGERRRILLAMPGLQQAAE